MTPLQWNLDSTGIRERLRVGPGNVWLLGDSTSAATVVEKRFYAAFLRAFRWPLRGVYIPTARLGGGGTDGLAVLHPTLAQTSANQGQYGPTAGGQFGLVDHPSTVLLATPRYERKWTGDSSNNARIGEHEVEGLSVALPGGSYEWGCGDWLSGRSVSVGLVYVKHPNGLDGVRLKTRIVAPSVNSGSALNTDKVAIDTYATGVGIGETVAPFGAEVPDGLIPSDWSKVGFQLSTPTDGTDETDKGLVKLYGRVFVDDAPDGVQFGVMAQSGFNVTDWMTATDPDLLAQFIEVTGADTFIFAFGANDSGSGLTKTQFKANVQALIDMIVAAATTAIGNDSSIRPPKFLLLGMHHVQDRAVMAEYADALYEISLSETYRDKAAFINLFRIAGAYNLINETLLEDGTHQSRIGAITLAQMLWNEIETVRPTVSGFADDAAAMVQGIAGSVLDGADGVESDLTVRQALRVMSAALAGRLTGAGGSTIRVRDVNDEKDRITATVDAMGNRTAITIDKD